MQTKLIAIDPLHIDRTLCAEAGSLLAGGGTVIFPTETVYGLGANALDAKAVERIFAAKGRPSDNPLIVHVASAADIVPLVERLTPMAKQVMTHFWPGPISIILKKSTLIPNIVTANHPTVALRMPSHPVAQSIIKNAGVPVAAPSANISGKPSPTAFAHVRHDMYGKVDMIVDGDVCEVGLESTVLDLSGDMPTILRPGAITPQMLEPVIGMVTSANSASPHDDSPKSPGMKYRHYAPNAQVVVVTGDASRQDMHIARLCIAAKCDGKRVGVLTYEDKGNIYNSDIVIYAGGTPMEYGSNLFAALRQFDDENIDLVYAPFNWTDEYSAAVANRLYKAADGRVARVE